MSTYVTCSSAVAVELAPNVNESSNIGVHLFIKSMRLFCLLASCHVNCAANNLQVTTTEASSIGLGRLQLGQRRGSVAVPEAPKEVDEARYMEMRRVDPKVVNLYATKSFLFLFFCSPFVNLSLVFIGIFFRLFFF